MRRSFTWKHLCYLLLTFCTLSCDFSSLDDAIIVSEVEDEFFVDLWENLDGLYGRELVVKIESIKSEKCLNYRIDYQFSKDGNRLKIGLNSIIIPLDCLPGEAAAKADVNTGSLPNGLYSFNIDLKNTVSNTGQIIVNDDNYTVDIENKGIVMRRKELVRVPDGAIWGYAAYQQAADQTIATQFVNDLKNISKAPDTYRSGYYGHFIITSDRQITVNGQTALSKPFLFSFQEEEIKLKNLIASYRQMYGNRLTIQFYNSKGEEL